jgi:hypothetical protein
LSAKDRKMYAGLSKRVHAAISEMSGDFLFLETAIFCPEDGQGGFAPPAGDATVSGWFTNCRTQAY